MQLNSIPKFTAVLMLFAISLPGRAQIGKKYDAIYSGVSWLDDRGKAVSAHAPNIVRENGRFYLFGEAHSDTSNAFAGFNCYSSPDLYNWKFERIALPVQAGGKLGPNRVGERAKVMKCPATGEFILYMHMDTLGYTDPIIGYATSKTITGPYEFKGPLLFRGQPIKRWDMGSFQDYDGTGYLLIHEGDIYRLSADYKSAEEKVLSNMANGTESPAVFHKGNTYYWLSSGKTSWERNDNEYYTASALSGPWTPRGPFAPKGTLTWNSQTTFVLPVIGKSDTTFVFMGDRWSYPRQASAATYVWQPLAFRGTELSLPEFREAWRIDPVSGRSSSSSLKGAVITAADTRKIHYSGEWASTSSGAFQQQVADKKGALCSVTFVGTQITWYGIASVNGGYVQVTLRDAKKRPVASAMVDLYAKMPVSAPRFVSPLLPKGQYTLTIGVLGVHGNWSDKRKNLYGSTGDQVSVEKFVVGDR